MGTCWAHIFQSVLISSNRPIGEKHRFCCCTTFFSELGLCYWHVVQRLCKKKVGESSLSTLEDERARPESAK